MLEAYGSEGTNFVVSFTPKGEDETFFCEWVFLPDSASSCIHVGALEVISTEILRCGIDIGHSVRQVLPSEAHRRD